MSKMEKLLNLCLRRAIVFPTAEIHKSYSGFYEYGPVGFRIKKKIIDLWREIFVKPYSFIHEIEGSLILPKKVFEASGHLENFVDPIVQCKKCKKIYRADHLIEDKLNIFVEGKSEKDLERIIREHNIRCPSCGGELGEVKMFNLMMKIDVGPLGDQTAFLRPETAQNIFTDFKRIYQSLKLGLPLGIAQIGKSFRNEISPRKFLIRLREFTQAEIELFFDPQKDCELEIPDVSINFSSKETGELKNIDIKKLLSENIFPNKWIAFFIVKEIDFLKKIGIPESNIRVRKLLPEETPHYSGGNFDIEVEFDFGWTEVISNAYRTDYDLKRHQEVSGKDLSVEFEGKKFIPHVVEPSFGIDRIFLAVIYFAFHDKTKERDWIWLKLPNRISPFDAAIFPLVKKDGLDKKAKEVFNFLKNDFDLIYEEKGSIGKRYARADEIGVPVSITVDYQSLQDETVTIRDIETRKQERIKIDKVKNFLSKLRESS